MPASKTLISYIVRYGGRCRDCADTTIGPICDGTGLPCGDGERAIQHVLAALAYGVKNGFIARDDEPDLLSTARAEARREALEEALRAAWSGFKQDDAAIAVCAIVDLLPPERRKAACEKAAAMTKEPSDV